MKEFQLIAQREKPKMNANAEHVNTEFEGAGTERVAPPALQLKQEESEQEKVEEKANQETSQLAAVSEAPPTASPEVAEVKPVVPLAQLNPPQIQLKAAATEKELQEDKTKESPGQLMAAGAPPSPPNSYRGYFAETVLQQQSMSRSSPKQPYQMVAKENNTGLPDNLKSGVENMSGFSMDDVKVHYNSDKPAQLNAHAYAQGTDIHVGSGQEKHLPHEAWHVVQQKQGRVQPTKQMKGKMPVNDDVGLEKEADVMGEKATKINTATNPQTENHDGLSGKTYPSSILQLALRSADEFRQQAGVDLGNLDLSINGSNPLAVSTEQDEAQGPFADEKLVRISFAIKDYNDSDDNPSSKFDNLNILDKLVNGWFAAKSAAMREMSKDDLNDVMVGLHKEIETEHVNLVNETKGNVDFIPFDLSNLQEDENKENLKTLWQDIVNNRGKIKIGGTPEYQQKTLARLVKMLETPTGRKMITYLNAPRPDLDNDADNNATNIYITNLISSVPPEVANGVEIGVSQSQPLNEDASKMRKTDASTNETKTILKPSDLLDSSLNNKRNIKYGDQNYEFGAGTGAVVYVEGEKVVGHPDENHHELFTPSYLTLAHELGHSVNQKAGSSPIGESAFMEGMHDQDASRGNLSAKFQWSDSEEFVNINNVENQIRDEAKLGGHRSSHKGAGLVRSVADKEDPQYRDEWQRRYDAIKARVDALVDMAHPELAGKLQIKVVDGLEGRAGPGMPQGKDYLLDDKTHDAQTGVVDDFERDITPESVKIARQAALTTAIGNVQESITKFNDAYQSLKKKQRKNKKNTAKGVMDRFQWYLDLLEAINTKDDLNGDYYNANPEAGRRFSELQIALQNFSYEINAVRKTLAT